jgi:drug/metabolite transporter (DMT)-like permease
MFAIALGLASSVCWGLADFLGGLQSRRVPVIGVLLFSQAAGLVGIVAIVGLSGASAPAFEDMVPAALAGIGGAIALSAFYRALAIGTMSIVAPISATGAAVPVIVGVATGDRPSALQVLGIAAATAGIVLASREATDDEERASATRLSIGLALFAALGFGSFFVGMKAAADVSVLWALVVERSASTAILLVYAAAARPRLLNTRSDLPPLVLIATLDLSANALYALASTEGLLSVVAVLGSLYPVTTVLLARLMLGERIRRVQEVGIVAALTGVALIAGG